MRQWINLIESQNHTSEFLESVDAYTIYNAVQSGHREPDDFIEGDLTDRIYWFDDYELTSLPIADIDLDEHYVDEDLVDDYIEHIKDSPKTMPPIVYDSCQLKRGCFESIPTGFFKNSTRVSNTFT